MRVVVDTMVWVRGVLARRAGSASGDILAAWKRGEFLAVASQMLLDEIARTLEGLEVLSRPVLDLAVSEIVEGSFKTPIRHQVLGCRDRADDHLLEAALTGGAEFIVTDDRDVLELPRHVVTYLAMRGVRLISVADFVSELRDRRIAAGKVLSSDLEDPLPPFSCLVCDHADHADAECTTAWAGHDRKVEACSCSGWAA